MGCTWAEAIPALTGLGPELCREPASSFVFASDLKATQPIYEMNFADPTAIVIGSEDEGVSLSILKAVDESFIIPQKGETDSLNVSVATGIMLYEAMRQRISSNGE